jgi:ATP-dependent Clp protease ATP-binding subunit ClpX
LMTVCERAFRDLKFELPSTQVKRFAVDAELVDRPVGRLQELLAEQRKEERAMLTEVVHEYGRRFEESHGLKLLFEAAAADRLVALAVERGETVRDLCAERFKDFQFGLKLVAQNTGQREFVIGLPVVESPDKLLSEWVVASYRNEGKS